MSVTKCLLAAALCGLILAACQSAPRATYAVATGREHADFYMAVNGSDEWSGRLDQPNATKTDGPFATLARARDAVRGLKEKSGKKDILVSICGGSYRLEEAVVFNLADSAPEGGSITYTAYENERPVFTSAVPIDGWKRLEKKHPLLPEKAREEIWIAEVPAELEAVRSLFDGTERLPRARSAGFTPVALQAKDALPPDQMLFPEGAVKNWPDLANGELRVIPNCDYEMCLLPLAEVDETKGILRTTAPASRTMGRVKFLNETAWVENVLEVLDEPGEWVYNAAERRIYLWPIGGTPSGLITAPKLTELIRVEGDIDYDGPTDTPVTGLTFKGLTFTGGERRPWDGDTHGELQHKWEHFDSPTALVRFRGTQDCAVDSCRFIDSSGTGLRLDLTSLNNRVVGNEMARLGGVGILVAGYGPGTKDVSKHNEVSNNWVHHIGEEYWASPAIMIWQSGENSVTHNLIHNTPYSGITVSGRTGWDAESEDTFRAHEAKPPAYEDLLKQKPGAETVYREWWEGREPYMHGRKNFVAWNDIHTIMEVMGDGNAIYISGTGRENHIYQNYIHHIDGDGTASGLRCDNDQYETIIEGNVLYKVRSAQTGISTTEMNHIINNIIVEVIPSRRPITNPNIVHGYISVPNEVWPFEGARIQRNIIWSPRADYWPIVEHKSLSTGAGDRLKGTSTDYNLYWCPGDPEWGQRHIDEQRGKGYGVETNSVSADPMFVDLERGDLRLKPESPAHKLGFEEWDVAKAGLKPGHPYYKP